MSNSQFTYDDLVAFSLAEIGEGDRPAFDEAMAKDTTAVDQLGRISNAIRAIRPGNVRLDDGFNRRLREQWLREIESDPKPQELGYRSKSADSTFDSSRPMRSSMMALWAHKYMVAGLSAAALAIAFGWLFQRHYAPHPLPISAGSVSIDPISRRPLVPLTPPVHGVDVNPPTAALGAWPMFALSPQRNAVSREKNPPIDWDIKTGRNILWSAALGSKSYGTPVISGGIVTVGTNNEGRRNPSINVDGGVEMAFDASTGKFLWQKFYPKLPTGRVNDWPGEGLCATGYAEPGRLWYCTNTCHVVCLDLSGTPLPDGSPPVIWDFDMIEQLGVFPHNMTSSAIAAWGNLIYVITGNGVDDTHKNVVAPDAPSIVCFDKNTGRVVWTDHSPGSNILHGQWASVAITEVGGRALAIAPLGDAWVYAFDAKAGKIIWKFDVNPKSCLYPGTGNEVLATPCIVGNYMYIGSGQDPEHGEGPGHFYCVDITGQGDISEEIDADPNAPRQRANDGSDDVLAARKGKPNPNSKVVWHFAIARHSGKIFRGEHMNRTISTAVVTPQDLCFIPDFSGFLHCLDAKTGEHLWSYDNEAAVWGSPLYVDRKVYLCDGDGNVRIFRISRKAPAMREVIAHDMGNSIWGSPVLANGVLYVMVRDRLYAIKTGAQAKPEAVQ
jgi:outer membrane protein assembly factor BamB